jgi:hypothetical protein
VHINLFRYISGLTILLTHVLSVTLIFRSTRFDDIYERIETISFISPILAVYFGVFIRFVISRSSNLDREVLTQESLSIIDAAVMYLLIIFFCVAIVYFVVDFNYFYAFEVNELRLRLGAVETPVGVTIGLIFDRLFAPPPESTSRLKLGRGGTTGRGPRKGQRSSPTL